MNKSSKSDPIEAALQSVIQPAVGHRLILPPITATGAQHNNQQEQRRSRRSGSGVGVE